MIKRLEAIAVMERILKDLKTIHPYFDFYFGESASMTISGFYAIEANFPKAIDILKNLKTENLISIQECIEQRSRLAPRKPNQNP